MRYVGATVVSVFVLLCSGLAEAQTEPEQTGGSASNVDAEIVALEAQSQSQEDQLVGQIQEVSAVGEDLQDTQTQVDSVAARSQELSKQAGELESVVAAQQKDFAEAEKQYKNQAQAAYKGDNVEGLIGILDSVLAADKDSRALTNAQIKNAMVSSRQKIENYRNSRQKLQNTVLQMSQKRSDYEEVLEERRTQIKKLQRREAELEVAVSQVREDKTETDERIQKLQKVERERISKTKPATGGSSLPRSRELRIARNDIVARPVEPIPKKRYRKLYRKAAKKYGFGKDWYILAAVGKVETNHGENMGPSSAGAMGPMQFMPSTWESSGVDGNGDGVANVMDPRDAIPAAAKYLKTGGAPQDWYAALYSYNHADWYVKKVLGVAEGYRRMAKDKRTGPYV